MQSFGDFLIFCQTRVFHFVSTPARNTFSRAYLPSPAVMWPRPLLLLCVVAACHAGILHDKARSGEISFFDDNTEVGTWGGPRWGCAG